MTLPTAEARRRRKARGLCLWCSQPPEPGRALCPAHAAYHRQQERRRYAAPGLLSPQPDADLLAALSEPERTLYLAEQAKPLGERWR